MPPRDRVLRALEGRGVQDLLRATTKRGAILAYHGLFDEPPYRSSLHVTTAAFQEQLEQLRGSYTFLPLHEFLERLRNGRSVRHCLAVSFDDAYRGACRAAPILTRLGIPATMFVPTSYVGLNHRYWWDLLEAHATGGKAPSARNGPVPSPLAVNTAGSLRERLLGPATGRPDPAIVGSLLTSAGHLVANEDLAPMTWSDLEAWVGTEGMDVAPHTLSHPMLPALPYTEQVAEIRESHALLSARLWQRGGRSPVLPIIAYPYGLYNRQTLDAARGAGMAGGVTMDRFGIATWDDMMRVPRIPVDSRTRMGRMGLFLTDFAAWYRRREMPDGYPALPRPTGHPQNAA